MPESSEEVRATVLQRFTTIANMPEQEMKFPVGPDSATAMGYDSQGLNIYRLPSSNRFVAWVIRLGWRRYSRPHGLGSWLRGRSGWRPGGSRVGPTGEVIGVDMTEAMIAKARRNVDMLHLKNVQFLLGSVDDIPMKDGSVDVAISNGVFNLCPDKLKVLSEVCRVLRPGGRLQMADILLHDDVTPEDVAEKGTWSD